MNKNVEAIRESLAENAVAAPNPYADRVFKASEEYPGKKREVVLFPDAALLNKATPFDFGMYPEFAPIIAADLAATAKVTSAAGLAAVQIGREGAVIVVAMDAGYVAMFNPVVTPHAHSKLVEVSEGCISFPGVLEKVMRHSDINVKYQDVHGRHHQMSLSIDSPATGSMCQTVQHECLHLEGHLFLQDMNIVRRDKVHLHMKKVRRNIHKILKMAGGKVNPMQVLFGFAPEL